MVSVTHRSSAQGQTGRGLSGLAGSRLRPFALCTLQSFELLSAVRCAFRIFSSVRDRAVRTPAVVRAPARDSRTGFFENWPVDSPTRVHALTRRNRALTSWCRGFAAHWEMCAQRIRALARLIRATA